MSESWPECGLITSLYSRARVNRAAVSSWCMLQLSVTRAYKKVFLNSMDLCQCQYFSEGKWTESLIDCKCVESDGTETYPECWLVEVCLWLFFSFVMCSPAFSIHPHTAFTELSYSPPKRWNTLQDFLYLKQLICLSVHQIALSINFGLPAFTNLNV